MDDDFSLPKLSDNPTPEERAEYVIKRLEQFIREGRTIDEGMSFRKWQAMAKTEIAIAIAEAENSQDHDEIASRRVLFIAAAAMVTIGFWGTAVSMHKVGYLVGGLVCLGAGIVMLLAAGSRRFRKYRNRKQGKERRERLYRIENLNRRIKRLEHELEKEEKALEKKIKSVNRPHGTSLYELFMSS